MRPASSPPLIRDRKTESVNSCSGQGFFQQTVRGLCGGIAAWPLAAYAQQGAEPRRIGILGADATVWKPWMAAFVTRLRELSWIVGANITIEYRWAEGSS